MDMLLYFQHAADQATTFVKATISVGMQDDFLFPTNQFFLDLITVIRMGMGGRLFLSANEFLRITLSGVSVAHFRLPANQCAILVITTGILRTNKGFLRFIAFCRMGMSLFRFPANQAPVCAIATCIMRMRPSFFLFTDQDF